MTTNDDKYAKRIADLLKMAESGDDAEAQAALEMAERLMARYGIDRAVAQAKGEVKNESIVEKYMTLEGIYHQAWFIGMGMVGQEIGVKVLGVKLQGNRTRLYVIGYESDVDNAITLFTSLQLQSLTGLRKWWAVEKAYVVGGTAGWKARRSYVLGFFGGARTRLQNAKRVVHVELGTGSEIAVRDRMAAVEKYVEKYETKTARGFSVTDGYGDGHADGMKAMTGESELNGKKEIGK